MKRCPGCGSDFTPKQELQTFCKRACSNRIYKRKYPAGYGSGSRLYNIWRGMHFRCYQPAHEAFERYHAKGIKVCEEWLSSYWTFAEWALANGYADDLAIVAAAALALGLLFLAGITVFLLMLAGLVAVVLLIGLVIAAVKGGE